MQSLGIGLMVLCSMLNSVGQFFFRASVGRDEKADGTILGSPKFWGGIGVYVFATLLNVYAFRFGELTILYPLTNLSLVWNLMFAQRLFGDKIGSRRILATAMIFVGCVIVVS